MAYIPLAQEVGAKYTLTSPDGVVAVFNDPSDPNYVGMLTDLSGLDSADVRESAMDLPEADGGYHGNFYFSRRPISMTASVFGHASILERSTRIDRARRASLALRGDSILKWTPNGGVEVFTTCRRQQPFRESGGWVKSIQLQMVSQYATIQGTALKTVAAGVAAENQGNYPAYPVIAISGSSSNPTVSDGSRVFRTTGLTLNADGSETVEFDMLNHTGVFTAGARTGQSANRYIDFATTQWPYLAGGGTTQTFALTGGGTTAISVRYRDTWA